MKSWRTQAAPALLALCLLGAPAASVAQGTDADSAKLQSDLTKALSKKELAGVHATLQNGVAVLTGTVDVFDAKEEAGRRVRRVKGLHGVDNEIVVAGPEVPDAELQAKLAKAIEYDRVGYGTTAFNAIGVSVQNGVVTLGGHAYGPVDADSAVAVASNTKGVKDVVNDIQVDPPSPHDDVIRFNTYRAVYGFPMLNKYAIDPAKPIRIQVLNGRVTLYGVVDTEQEKEAAGIRANTVPGVFQVTNNLQVAQAPEAKK